MATLYDEFNRPIDLSALRQEQARPSLAGVRQIVSGHPAQGLTPGRLARILREAEDGDATRYLELAEEMEEKDLHYLSVLGTRKRAISQLEITVEAASEDKDDVENADLVRQWLKREELEDELFDILDAVGKGYSATEIIWETSEKQWWPARLEWRMPQWFEFDRNDGRTLMLRGEAGPEPLAPFKFIVHTHKAKSGLAIRGGLARGAAWGYLFKNYDLKDWIAFIEVYGHPIRVGKYHPGATAEEKEILLRAVANIGSDAAAIVPQGMLLEFVRTEAARETGVLFKEFAEFVDAQISKAVLGQTLTTEVGDTGSYAAANVHNDVRGDIGRSDAKQVAMTVTRDVVRPFIDLNRGPQKAYPRVKIGWPEATDVAQLSEALAKLVPLGLRVRQSEVRGKLSLSEPDEGDEILKQAPGLPAPAFAKATAAQRGPQDRADDLTPAAEDNAQPGFDEIVAEIRRLIESAGSLDDVSAALLAMYPKLSAARLADAMREALVLAELMGRSDIVDRV